MHRKLQAAGVTSQVVEWKGMTHCAFDLLPNIQPDLYEAFIDDVASFVRRTLRHA